MKKDTHPTYHLEAKVTCACGNSFTTGSTKPEIRVEICNKCHPFFTGTEKFIDTEGRVERFQRQKQEADTVKAETKKKTDIKPEEKERPRSLKEMMEFIQKGG
ncbi:MAG: 50S ribosomal protein L31 [Candidatus Woykebacteria bacterium RBG_13_40_15]|uniref:Large ribosomal subunit protein bL31 n=1 Tax=Candidatus Woykebacteria bacterium RBG_13_40_15 TaxID=1802593 RepID=A0A1G1W671_9BACT|nr:MAG: 50S ribosomal protein L31 [Candidatus Woykebacteria bacterium RBG_13_40_15]